MLTGPDKPRTAMNKGMALSHPLLCFMASKTRFFEAACRRLVFFGPNLSPLSSTLGGFLVPPREGERRKKETPCLPLPEAVDCFWPGSSRQRTFRLDPHVRVPHLSLGVRVRPLYR